MRRQLAVALALSWLGGCAPSPAPCTTPGTCPEQHECIANRCVVVGSDPASPRAARLVLWPDALALSGEGGALPVLVSFGAALGEQRLYLRFPPRWGQRRVEVAFLVLSAAPRAAAPSEPVLVSASLPLSQWRGPFVSTSDAPSLGAPQSQGLARGRSPLPLRLDVTSIVRQWAQPGQGHRGLVLSAPAGAGLGASYSLGTGEGPAPYLELYFER